MDTRLRLQLADRFCPTGTFVAEHAMESLSLLHAVMAVAAINQSPLSVEVRAESLLYFEASVDLHVRSLQQQDDISLFTLLMLSLYYAFDSGTTQSQHFSRRAQGIINERLEQLRNTDGHSSSINGFLDGAGPDFRFLVRCHVWYEVLANLSRLPGDLRDLEAGKFTLTALLAIIERWDVQEEKQAGLSGINRDYAMTGLNGVPTFFIGLLNDITLLKEEQCALLNLQVDGLDEAGQTARRALISKHARKIRDLVSRSPHCVSPTAHITAFRKRSRCPSGRLQLRFLSDCRNARFSSLDPAGWSCRPSWLTRSSCTEPCLSASSTSSGWPLRSIS